MPLGDNVARALDVRIIAATNADIDQLIAEKRFRADLYYRLSQTEIVLPPLRNRLSDIPAFVEYFNERTCAQFGLPYSPFPSESIQAFSEYNWPGNVRELRSIVERCLIFCGQGADVLPEDVENQLRRKIS